MNYRRFALVVTCASLLSAPAFSASVVMMQFGSFETRDEAQARLSQIQSRHADLLSGLETTIREVTLPPDNLTVYRTQAGPLPSRAAAQSTCAKLAGNGDECYVVETAMITPPPASSMTAARPAPVMATPQPMLASAPTLSASVTAPAEPAQAIPLLPPAHLPSVGEVAPSPLPPLSASINATPMTASSMVTPSVTVPNTSPLPPSPALQSAMDQAVANQQAAEASAASAPVASASQTRPSFWSRLNPFTATPAAKPVEVAVKPSVEPIQEASLTPLPPAPPEANPSFLAANNATPAPPPLTASPAQPLLQPLVAVQPAAPVSDMRLPPPPPPLLAQNGRPAPIAQAPIVPYAPAPLPPRPMMTPPVAMAAPAPASMPAPVPFRVSPSVATGGGEVAASGPGNVSVEEARRVPLTANTVPPTSLPSPIPAPLSLSPSSTIGEKTWWAQISYFPDTQSALAFWDRYRQTHPDFPVVRVRVVSSLQQGSDGSVSLRVGPFARDAFINSLCFTVADQGLRCGKNVDLGIAATSHNGPGYLPGSRYNR